MTIEDGGNPGVAAVSVIVPAYNSGWSVERTIESVLAQTFADFELLLINDGSTDDLHARVARFRRDPRFRVIDQDNRGLAGARNRGLAEARGAFVAPIDADDVWRPDFLAAAVAALRATPDAPFAYAYSFRIDEQDRPIPHVLPRRAPRHDQIGLLTLNSVGNGSAAVFRRALVMAVGGYDETMRERGLHGAEDWKLVLQLAAVGRPVLIPRALVGYRLVVGGMSRGDPSRQLAAAMATMADIRAAFPAIAPRHFRNGRTMITAWLLPVFLGRRMWAATLGAVARGYLANPLWILNADLRDLHLGWLRLKLRRSAPD